MKEGTSLQGVHEWPTGVWRKRMAFVFNIISLIYFWQDLQHTKKIVRTLFISTPHTQKKIF